MFFLFRKKERTKEKSILSFSRLVTFYSFFGVTAFFIREAARGYCFNWLFRYESAAFTECYYSRLPRFVILSGSGYRESGLLF